MAIDGTERQPKLSLRPWKHEVALFIPLVIFLAIKLPHLHPRFSDGWIYFYFGKLIAGGAIPYSDFFYTSPPLLPYVSALIHEVFGFRVWLAELLPVLLTSLDALLIFHIVRGKAGRPEALLAVAAYLFSFVSLSTTDYFSEAHLLTSLALAGFLLFLSGRHGWSGAFFGLSGLVKVYGLLPAAFLPLLLLSRRRDLVRFIEGIAFSFGLVNLLFWGLVGPSYFDLTFFNHFNKPAGIAKERILSFFLAHDWPLVVAISISFIVKSTKQMAPFLAVLGPLPIFYLVFPDIYYLYLKVFIALAATGFGIALAQERWHIQRRVALVATGCLLALNALMNSTTYLTEQWKIARIPQMEKLISTVTHETAPGEPLYGSFEVTPLIALLSNRPIFRNYVDTNSKLVNMGLVSPAKRASELEEAHVPLIITKALVDQQVGVIHGLDRLLPPGFLTRNCSVREVVPIPSDYEDNAIIIWRCHYENKE